MSEGDVWSIREPSAAGYPRSVGVRPVLPPDPDYLAWLTVGVFFLIAGVLHAAVLFTRAHMVAGSVGPAYETIAIDAVFGARIVVMLGCGALLLVPRARALAGGLAVGFGLTLLSGYFWQLRPSNLRSQLYGLGSWLLVGAFALVTAATIIVLVVLLRRRERVSDARTAAERRADRVAAVALGFAGAALWWIATTLTWYRIGLSGSGGSGILTTDECCSWSQDDGWKQVGILVGGATILVLALFAATVNSKLRAAGLLLGVVAASLQDVVLSAITQIAPMPTLYGIHYRQLIPGDINIVSTATAGFWLSLVAVLLLSVAAVSRLALGPRKAAYPQSDLERIAS